MTSVIFDISRDGYNWLPAILGVFVVIISIIGLYIAIKQKSRGWSLRMGISLFISFLWLTFGLFGTYSDYIKSINLYQPGNYKILEGYVSTLDIKNNKQQCNGFSVNSIDFCHETNKHLFNINTRKYIQNGQWVRIHYVIDQFDGNANIVILMEVKKVDGAS